MTTKEATTILTPNSLADRYAASKATSTPRTTHKPAWVNVWGIPEGLRCVTLTTSTTEYGLDFKVAGKQKSRAPVIQIRSYTRNLSSGDITYNPRNGLSMSMDNCQDVLRWIADIVYPLVQEAWSAEGSQSELARALEAVFLGKHDAEDFTL